MGLIWEILKGSWTTFLVLSPLFLLGLLVGGLLNILITRRRIEALMGSDGLKSVMMSAATGMPIPLCSCGVVPVAVTLGKKGASQPATMSFLITTPESGADSILVTWVLMGPWVAIYRPLASLLTALLAGVFAIGLLPPFRSKSPEEEEHDHDHGECCHDHGPGHEHHHHDVTEDHDYVGFGGIWLGLKVCVLKVWHRLLNWGPLHGWYKPAFYRSRRKKPKLPKLPKGVPTLGETCRRVFRYAFVELADDILFSLLIGILLAGVILAVFPSNLADYGLGAGWISYLVMLAAGIPLYMCASASTPIAAALVMQGLSPGAAIVFLLSGPATNMATITTLTKHYGGRFMAIYLGSIAVGSVAAGAVFDLLAAQFGWSGIREVALPEEGLIGFIEWTSAILLVALVIWRFSNGAALAGLRDLTGNLRRSLRRLVALIPGSSAGIRGILQPKALCVVALVGGLVYLATGFFTVPPGHVGYGKLFGRIKWKDMTPGLHYLPPGPFVKVDVWPTKHPFRLTIGLTGVEVDPTNETVATAVKGMNVVVAKEGKPVAGSGGASSWHVSGSSMAQKKSSAEFLAGDQNFIKILITVVYNIVDPYRYYYRVENPDQMIASAVQSAAREYVAQNVVDDLLSRNRSRMEAFILEDVRAHLHETTGGRVDTGASIRAHESGRHEYYRLDADGIHEIPALGVNLQSVNLIDIHPPEETILAFQDVSSAMEDRHSSILEAEKVFTLMIPQAAGNALVEVKTATAKGESRRLTTTSEAKSIIVRAAQVGPDRKLLENVLWFETMERTLTGKETFVLPPGVAARDLTLWRTMRPKITEKHSK